MVSFPWSRCQMCYSVVNNYLSAGRNRFDLESGPWTIRATCGKEALYQLPIKFADWRLKSTWFCPVVLAGTCVADDAATGHFIFCWDMMTRVVYFSATFNATRLTFWIVVVAHALWSMCRPDRLSSTQKQCSNWKCLSFLIRGHVCMDGTPVDNNRLVLAPFLNTLTVHLWVRHSSRRIGNLVSPRKKTG